VAEVTPLAEGPERRQVLGLDAGGCLRSVVDPWPWRSLMVIDGQIWRGFGECYAAAPVVVWWRALAVVRDDARSLAWAEALRNIVGSLHGGGGDASCGLALFASFVGCGAA
jgi:hypothetical protein